MNLKTTLQEKINQKTKPLGALGQLESLALQIGLLQESLNPKLEQPHILLFAGDHGIAQIGVSAYPQAVTHQMVLNFLNQGAAINVFAKQAKMNLSIIDAGVNFDFPKHPKLIDQKIAKGTENFLYQAAMTEAQLETSLSKGASLVRDLAQKGCNVVGFGEMGIGNTSAAAMLMSYLCKLPLEVCVGRGTGLNNQGLERKLQILKQAQAKHGPMKETKDILQHFAGFEMVQMCGAMLEAGRQNMLILVDGFIASSVFMAAYQMEAKILDKAIFCHLSDEQGHRLLLEQMQAQAILHLGMRLGEGTGCALAYPLIEAAVAFLNEMASFETAKLSPENSLN